MLPCCCALRISCSACASVSSAFFKLLGARAAQPLILLLLLLAALLVLLVLLTLLTALRHLAQLLLHLLIGGLSLLTLLAGLPLLTALLAGLALLTLLALLALLTLLPLLTLLTLLALLSIAAELALLLLLVQLIELLAQLLGFAAQHFLLVALLGSGLRVFLLLLGKLLLPLGQFGQLLQRIVHRLLLLVGRLSRLLALVLILLRVEFEIEKSFEIAGGAVHAATSTAAASALAAHGDLDIAEGGFGAQQILQRLLLGRKGILPFGALQLIRGRLHGGHGLLHIGDEALERIAGFIQFAALHALGERRGLIAQLGLHAGKERRVFGVRTARAGSLLLVPGGGDDLFLALRDLILLVAVIATASAATAAFLLRLGVVALERLRFDEEDVGLRSSARVASGGVEAHHIAGLHLEIFERDDGAAVRFLGAFRLEQRTWSFRRCR